MNWIVTIYAALLFFILTPAVLVRLPPKGGKYTVAAFHALVFALIFHFTAKFVWQVSRGLEGFQEGLTWDKFTDAEKKANCNAESNINPAYDGSSIETPTFGKGKQVCLTGANVTYCKGKDMTYKSLPGNHVCTPKDEPKNTLTKEQIKAYKDVVAILKSSEKKELTNEQIAALKLGARTS